MTTTTETADTTIVQVQRETEPVVLTEDEKALFSKRYLVHRLRDAQAPFSPTSRPLIYDLEDNNWWKPGEEERFLAWRFRSGTKMAEIRRFRTQAVRDLCLPSRYLNI